MRRLYQLAQTTLHHGRWPLAAEPAYRASRDRLVTRPVRRAAILRRRSITRCRELGLEAICDVFPSAALVGRQFDVVVMNDLLEHLPDPAAALAAAGDLLAPAGVLFITTPDVGSLLARMTGARWLHLKPNEHLNRRRIEFVEFFRPLPSRCR